MESEQGGITLFQREYRPVYPLESWRLFPFCFAFEGEASHPQQDQCVCAFQEITA